MSLRDAILPPRAAVDRQASLSRRLIAVERRSNWNGAPRVATIGDFPQPPGYIISDPTTPGYPQSVASIVLSLTLDPGRWIILFAATLAATVSGGWSEVGMIPSVDHDGITETGKVVNSSGNSGVGFGFAQGLTYPMEVIGAETNVVAHLAVYAGGVSSGGPLPYSNRRFTRASITAFPG